MIKSARMRKGLTQKELASLVGVSQSYISKLESRQKRHIENLTVKTIIRLAKVLNLQPTDVFTFVTSYKNDNY